MKIKTKDLTGAALDWAVAKATRSEMPSVQQWMLWNDYHPTKSWLLCGPLLEKHLFWLEDQGDNVWGAEGVGGETQYGPTPLIAICRAVVACKLGDEVEVPDELVQGGAV